MDLALWLIRQKSPEFASPTARYLIVDSRPSRMAYVPTDHRMRRSPSPGNPGEGRDEGLLQLVFV
jgi:hypothetical protein